MLVDDEDAVPSRVASKAFYTSIRTYIHNLLLGRYLGTSFPEHPKGSHFVPNRGADHLGSFIEVSFTTTPLVNTMRRGLAMHHHV